ncbi:Uncharacterized protein dnm_013060 [Desulfonema magnum]|uniref:Uncharacterized protein n=1 Tax=Desulfonema magnum TaxID=45655 RepID=A0A975GKZ1_9BACT|nr:Uncharacterized protein dnm_013060 [Desulfonema magnum]
MIRGCSLDDAVFKYRQDRQKPDKLIPRLRLSGIKLSFRSAKIIFLTLAGNAFCHSG